MLPFSKVTSTLKAHFFTTTSAKSPHFRWRLCLFSCLRLLRVRVFDQRTRSGQEVERWRQSLQRGSLVDAMDPNNTWTNATVVDVRERLGAPVVLGVGPIGGNNAGDLPLFVVCCLSFVLCCCCILLLPLSFVVVVLIAVAGSSCRLNSDPRSIFAFPARSGILFNLYWCKSCSWQRSSSSSNSTSSCTGNACPVAAMSRYKSSQDLVSCCAEHTL